MKKILLCTVIGFLGTLPFFLGAASSSGSNFAVLALPSKLLQYAVLNWGLSLDDVQLNRWAVFAQFFSYFVLTYCVMVIKSAIKNKEIVSRL